MAKDGKDRAFYKDFVGNFLGGIDGGVDPHLLPKTKLAWGINSTVRGGFVRPRPKTISCILSDGGISIVGGTSSVIDFVQSGTFQGATRKAYLPNSSSILPGPTFFALISSRLFGFTPNFSVNGAGEYVATPSMVAVKEYTIDNGGTPDLNSTTAPQAWLGQAENYLIVQDGSTPNPLIFDGNNSFRSYSLQQDVSTFSSGTTLVVPAQGGVIVGVVTTDMSTIDPEFFNIPVAVFAPSGGISAQTGPPATPAYSAGEYMGQMTLAIIPPMTGGAVLSTALTGTVAPGDTIFIQNTNYPISNLSTNVNGAYPVMYSSPLTVNTADANNAQIVTGFVSGSLVAVVTVQQWAVKIGSPYGSPPVFTGYTTQVTSNAITPSMISSGSFTIPLPSDPYGTNSRITAIVLKYQAQSATPIVTYTPIGTIGGTSSYTFPDTAVQVELVGGASYPSSSTQGATVYVGSDTIDPSTNLQCTIDSPSTSTTYYLTNKSIVEGVVLKDCTVKTSIGIPCGKAWAYSQGRIWTTLPDGRNFVAGDNVGGSSGTAANGYLDAILYTMQNMLLSNGGTFSVPGNYGTIRAMTVAPTLNVQLGQGPLQVLTEQCIFSVNAPTDITTWASLTTPIVVVSLVGAGALSHQASLAVNGDILFRSTDGIRSMTVASLDFYKWNQTPCSQEVGRAINGDDPSLLGFCSAVQFDNRVIFGCSPVSGMNGAYFQNAVVMNLDTISNLQSKSPAVWDGEWTGLNTLQWMTGIFGNEVRCFSFASNGTAIGLLELLTTDDGQDITNTTASTLQIETPVLFGKNELQGQYAMFRLEDGELYFRNILGLVTFTVEYKPDYDPMWYPWYSWTVDNTKGLNPFKNRMGLGVPSRVSRTASPETSRDAYDYQLRITVAGGSAEFMGGLVKASIVPQTEFAPPIVSPPPLPPPPIMLLKQAFAGLGPPKNQNPDGEAGIYFDALGNEVYLWLGTEWETGITPTGSFSICSGRQAFAGSGGPTAATPTPANNAGTYFDYTNQVLTFWNPAGYWGFDTSATGSGVIVTSLGVDYLSDHGVPGAQIPANGAGIYYDLDTLTVYNWNPTTNTWI